jgi:hypothetical protein
MIASLPDAGPVIQYMSEGIWPDLLWAILLRLRREAASTDSAARWRGFAVIAPEQRKNSERIFLSLLFGRFSGLITLFISIL